MFLVGPDDAVYTTADRYIIHLVIIGRYNTYPLHEHRIKEAYYVVAGHANWLRDEVNWVTWPPGAVFFKRSWESHTICTDDEPLLFLSFFPPPFGWEGGLVEAQGKGSEVRDDNGSINRFRSIRQYASQPC